MIVAFSTAWRCGYFRLNQPGKNIPSRIALQGFLFFLILQLLSPFIFSILSFAIPFSSEKSGEFRALMGLAVIYFIGLCMVMFYHFYKNNLRFLFRSNHFLKDCLLGFVTWLIVCPLIVFFSQWITYLLGEVGGFQLEDQIAVKQIREVRQYPKLFYATLFTVLLFVPLLEEFIFRGFLQSAISNYVNRYYAILLTAIIFSLFHFSVSQGINNLNILSALFLLSLFLGFLRERQGSLVAPIVLHIVFNTVSVSLIFLT